MCKISLLTFNGILLLLFWLSSHSSSIIQNEFTPIQQFRIAQRGRLRRMDKNELALYLDKLERANAIDELLVVLNAPYFIPQAAGSYVRVISPEKAIVFCTQLEIGSAAWTCAFYALCEHKKMTVIGYIKQMATSVDPTCQYLCFELCHAARWNDLLDVAKLHRDNPAPIVLQASPTGETVGTAARKYLSWYKKD